MAATGAVTRRHPHAHVCETEREYLIELDVPDVDVGNIVAAYAPDGALQIRAPRVKPAHPPFTPIHAEAEACFGSDDAFELRRNYTPPPKRPEIPIGLGVN
jgi:HSP20 family molecular chaperone IbpA